MAEAGKVLVDVVVQRVHLSSSDGLGPCWCRPVPVAVGSAEPYRELQRIVGEAVGAGSTCWEDLNGAGIFQSSEAAKVVEDALAEIMDKFTLYTKPVV